MRLSKLICEVEILFADSSSGVAGLSTTVAVFADALFPCNFLAIVFTSSITRFEISNASTALTTLVISLRNGLNTISLALTAFVHGGRFVFTAASAVDFTSAFCS